MKRSFTKKIKALTLSLTLGVLLMTNTNAQVMMEVVAANLKSPVGVTSDPDGNIWIAEQGTGNNDGGVSVLWADGTVTKVVDSLDSAFNPVLQEISGPLSVEFIGDFVYVYNVDLALNEVTPLLFKINSVTKTVTLKERDAVSSINWSRHLHNLGIHESNPYSFVTDGCDIIMSDAAANAIIRRDGLTGTQSIVASFGKIPNPTPIGPPVIDPVPTKLLKAQGDGWYVSQLTGFPFVDGLANVNHVSSDGMINPVWPGMTLVTDMDYDFKNEGLLALRFAQFRLDSMPPFVIGSSAITHLKKDGSITELLTGFGPSPGMAVHDNEIFVSQLFFGNVLKISGLTTNVKEIEDGLNKSIKVFPNPIAQDFTAEIYLPLSSQVYAEIYDLTGRLISKVDFGYIEAGSRSLNFSIQNSSILNLTQGQYFLRIKSNKYEFGSMISKM